MKHGIICFFAIIYVFSVEAQIPQEPLQSLRASFQHYHQIESSHSYKHISSRANCVPTFAEYYSKDTGSTVWQKDPQRLFIHDLSNPDGKKQVLETYDSTSQNWVPMTRIYTYGQGDSSLFPFVQKIDSTVQQEYLNNQWEKIRSENHYYDAFDRLIESEYWSYSNNQKQLTFKHQYFRDSSGGILYQLTYADIGAGIQKTDSSVYFNNSSGMTDSIYNYSSIVGNPSLSSKSVYHYNAANDVIEENYYQKNGSVWSQYQTMEYKYYAPDKPSEIKFFEYSTGMKRLLLTETFNYNSNGCWIELLALNEFGDMDQRMVFSYDPVGWENNKPAESIEIFPNPADNFLSIRLEEVEAVSVRILDLNGREVQQPIKVASQSMLHINVSDYPKGLYLISIQDSAGKRYDQKFLVH